MNDADTIVQAALSGGGRGWHEHNRHVHIGCERFFRPGYQANLVSSWLPALDGVEAKLTAGARVADVGCGHGASTILMAQAYPSSEFIGSDYHPGSIEVGAARRVRDAIADDGTWMLVEPRAGDRVEDNLNPVGRVYYAFSTLLCTPASLSQPVGLALGTQAGPARLNAVTAEAGFTRSRRAAETPFNMVLEVRP